MLQNNVLSMRQLCLLVFLVIFLILPAPAIFAQTYQFSPIVKIDWVKQNGLIVKIGVESTPDPAGTPTAKIDWGDGSNTGSGTFTHTYTSAGTYSISYTVFYTNGVQENASTMVTVSLIPNDVPIITSVSPIDDSGSQTIIITGVGFGTTSPYYGKTSNFIQISDSSKSWNAGYGGDLVTLNVESWTDSQIIIDGFSGAYGGAWNLSPNDFVTLEVWNAQTGKGPDIEGATVGNSIPNNQNSVAIQPSVTTPLPGVTQQSFDIPSWVKNTAGWWATGQVGDADFIKGIQYLIQQGIIQIPQTTQSVSSISQQIPAWVKNTAGWWATGQVGDADFIKGIQYLIQIGIMQIPQNTQSNVSVESQTGTTKTNSAQSLLASSQGLPTLNGAMVNSSQNSLELPSGSQAYIFGMATGGAAVSSNFTNGQVASALAGSGNMAAAISFTKNNQNSFDTSAMDYVIGGVGVSQFKYYGEISESDPSNPLFAGTNFTLTSPALVVVVGLAGGESFLGIEGLPVYHLDASNANGFFGARPPMMIVHQYLNPGTYVVYERTGPGNGQVPANEADLIGVFAFSNTSGGFVNMPAP